MKPQTKTLRQYQEKLVFNVCRAADDVLVEQPTGSGKTVQIVTLVAMHLGKRFTHAVIAAPQEQIEQGFVKRDYKVVAFPERAGVAVPSIQVPKQTILGARDSKVGSVKRVLQYLRQPGPLDHAFACTHAALNRITADDLPDDLTGKALFIDEAHHASADGLSQIVTLWRERGGQLFFFTATPYRGDGRSVKLDGMTSFRRSLAEHMAEGFAPRHLESEIVALGQPGDHVTAAQFTGEEAPPSSYFDSLVAAISRRWRDDGKPKAIVRVPPMQGGKSGELVRRLIQALAAENARVLDATGTSVADKQRFLAGLKAEQQQTFATSTFDVMIGIQRVLEGTDWPLCSAVYCVGMPGSLNTVVQFLGRAMRLKGPDYPAEQRDRAKLVFFVPCGGGSALTDLSIDHSRHALLTCCFLADHEVGQEWIVTQEVRRGIEAALGPRADNPAAIDAENDADEPLDPQIRAEVELAMADAREQIIQTGNEPTVGAVVQRTAEARPDLPAAAIQRVATEILAATDNPAGSAARQAIGREIATRLRIDPKVKQAMTAAFAVVLQEFRDATLKDSAVLESVGRQVHGVTGGQMREFAQRLKVAARIPLTEEQILKWADTNFQETGDWPKVISGEISAAPGENWANINAALDQGLRSLPGGSSLAKLLFERRGERTWASAPDLTTNQIGQWVAEHLEENGEYPSKQSGQISGTDGETWARVDAALKAGLRGLPGGSTLVQFLEAEYGVRNRMNLRDLTVETVKGWVTEHHDTTGAYPTYLSGEIAGTNGETWASVGMALRLGYRGFAGGSSLASLIQEEFGVKNIHNLAPLSPEQLKQWVQSHLQRTGEYPAASSGRIPDTPGETWQAVNLTLSRGRRGFPGGSSLAQFIADEFGVRNRGNLAPFTLEQIREWVAAWYSATGKYPTRTSGEIPATDGETWAAVNDNLISGSRGLPGGSSLPRFLEREFGVRNRLNTPKFTLEQVEVLIRTWREKTGEFPSKESGQIPELDCITWRIVDKALRRGSHGLPGGSSLPQFLEQRFGTRNIGNLPQLTPELIKGWIDEYLQKTGKFPIVRAGEIPGTNGETWHIIDKALSRGVRGLPGGSSLFRFVQDNFPLPDGD